MSCYSNYLDKIQWLTDVPTVFTFYNFSNTTQSLFSPMFPLIIQNVQKYSKGFKEMANIRFLLISLFKHLHLHFSHFYESSIVYLYNTRLLWPKGPHTNDCVRQTLWHGGMNTGRHQAAHDRPLKRIQFIINKCEASKVLKL